MAIRVAYQGVAGAYSEKAVRQLLGSSPQLQPQGKDSFAAAFDAVSRGDAEYAVIPIENSLGGSIHASYDLMLSHPDLHIIGETDLRVEHALLARPGVSVSDVKTVISHPQALAQCAHSIAQIGAISKTEYDTAGSAKMLADHPEATSTAAIASDLAAEYYGLEVLQRNFEDDPTNFTRFLLLAKRQEDESVSREGSQESKTSILFSFVGSNERGQLYKALSAFSLRDIDLAKIESRPWGYSAARLYGAATADMDYSNASPLFDGDRSKYNYLFYVDVIGHETDEDVMNALRHLRELCNFVHVLGSYPTQGTLSPDVRSKLASVNALDETPKATSQSTHALSKPQKRRKVGIYGFGNFGQFLAKTFTKYFDVRATSRTDYSDVASKLGCSFYNSSTQLADFFSGLDVVVLCVSILSFESVVKSLPANALDNIVVVDVLSVKTHPKQTLLKELPSSASILCTHPMFGPESGKYSWRGLPMMFERVRAATSEHEKAMDDWLRIFEVEACQMLDMTCEQHDEYAASSQFLTHFTGRVLSQQGVQNTPIDTRGFKNLVRLVEDTCKDSFELFRGLHTFNPNSKQQIQKFREALDTVESQLEQAPVKKIGELTMADKYPLNPLLGRVPSSKTVVIHGMTKQLEAEGKQVHSLCVGEPDFPPPERVLRAGMDAFEQGIVKYTDVKGTLELRKLIGQYLHRCKNVEYDPMTEILVSNGAKQSVYQALFAICHPGDQVLLPSPYWVSYPSIVKLVNAEAVVLPTKLEDGYLIDPKELEETLTRNPKIKAMVLCNPSNPAGTLHLPDHLEKIAAVLRKPQFQHIVVLADEIYEQLVYQDDGSAHRSHQCFASLPGMYERTLVLNGFSKSYAMTGLRIGYVAGPKYFVQTCTKLQGQITSCASSVGQVAACEALRIEMECLEKGEERIAPVLKVMDEKRRFVIEKCEDIPHLKYAHPTSAFYAFMDLSYYFENKTVWSPDRSTQLRNTDDFCEFLLREYLVALVPGSAFGEVYGLRISYACGIETLRAAMDGLKKALASLHVE